jgi:hypothetical protein
MAIIVNNPEIQLKESHTTKYGTFEYYREFEINVRGRRLFKDIKNPSSVNHLMSALHKWKPVPEDSEDKRAAIEAQLNRNGGELRRLIEKSLTAIIGPVPEPIQDQLDAKVQRTADGINTLACDVDIIVGHFMNESGFNQNASL